MKALISFLLLITLSCNKSGKSESAAGGNVDVSKTADKIFLQSASPAPGYDTAGNYLYTVALDYTLPDNTYSLIGYYIEDSAGPFTLKYVGAGNLLAADSMIYRGYGEAIFPINAALRGKSALEVYQGDTLVKRFFVSANPGKINVSYACCTDTISGHVIGDAFNYYIRQLSKRRFKKYN